MIRQLNAEGNLELVLTPLEAASLVPVLQAATVGKIVGANASRDDLLIAGQITVGAFMYSNDRLIENLMSQHAEHEGDDVDELREMYTDMVEGVREALEEEGVV